MIPHRLLKKLRCAFPGVRFRIRLEGGFAEPALLDFLEAQGDVEYVVGTAKNAGLKRKAKRALRQARRLSRCTGKTAHVYAEAAYAAGTWSHRRRMTIKAEVVRQEGKQPKDDPRILITNLRLGPQWIYEVVYYERGDIENRIKELHEGMAIGRTSCTSFWANQLHVLMTAAAYVLMQELRLRAARTPARAEVWILWERLLKLRAQVVASVRRIVMHLPPAFPDLDTFQRLALSLGGGTG